MGRLKQDPNRVKVLAGETFNPAFAEGVPELVYLADPARVVVEPGHTEVDALKALVQEGLVALHEASDDVESTQQ